MEKTEGQKSRDTVPLRSIEWYQNVQISWAYHLKSLTHLIYQGNAVFPSFFSL
jgi:hypothetical protein